VADIEIPGTNAIVNVMLQQVGKKDKEKETK